MTRPDAGLRDPPTPSATVRRLARSAPGRIAVIDRGRPVTYAALDQGTQRLAGWLVRQGVAPGDLAGLTLRDELAHLLATLALLRLGCDQVTLPRWDPVPMRAALAARLRVVVLLAEDAADGLAGITTLVPDIAAIAADAAQEAASLPVVGQGSGAMIFASSGTTGAAKLVRMTEGVLAAQSALTAGIGAVRHRLATNEYSNGKRLQLQTLCIGGTEVLANNGSGHDLAGTCRAFGVERLNLAPQRAARLLEDLDRDGAAPWPRGTAIMISGGMVPGALRAGLEARATRQLFVSYGCTEAGGMAMAGPGDHALHPDTVGPAYPTVTVEVVDDEGLLLPAGACGHVRVRSAACVDGYLDDPAATARAFRDGWFHPGDAGFLTREGALVLAGRSDDMMNLGSIKIFPAEIEAAVQGFPGLVECAAFAMRSPALGDIPMLAVVAQEGFDAAALSAHARERLGLRAPRKVVVVHALPRNARGKVLRRELPDLVARMAWPDAAAPPGEA